MQVIDDRRTTNLRLRALPMWIRRSLDLYSAKHSLAGVEAAVYHILSKNRELKELSHWVGDEVIVRKRRTDSKG